MNEKEKDEDRARSQSDWLQKAQKQLTEAHCSIMGARAGGGDITTRVDLRCGQDGWHGRWNAVGPEKIVNQRCGWEARLVSLWETVP